MNTLQERVHAAPKPDEWKLDKLHQVFRVRRGKKNAGMKEDNLLSLSYGRIIQKDIETADGLLPENFEGYQIVEPGNIVLRLTDLQNDKRSLRQGLTTQRGIITSAYDAVEVQRDNDPRFWFYSLLALDLAKHYYSLGGGVRQSVKFADFPNDWVYRPDLPAQRAIADFLDRETARIDSLIEKKQRLMELLGEKRSAVITASVTGQHSEFSDAFGGRDCRSAEGGGGVSDLGLRHREVRKRLIVKNEFPNIPDDWGVKRLRFLFTESKERNGKTPVGEMLSVSEYHGVIPREYEDEDQKRTDEELENYRVVRPGQLAVNSMWLNHLGLGVSEHTGHVSPAYNVYDISEKLDRRFVHHLLRSNYYLKIYLRYLYGIRPNSFQIKSNDWASIPILSPDLPTQRAIADFLDRETARIDSLIEKTRASIDRLKEYRSALITSAVTGQIDVSTYARSETTDRQLDSIQSEMQA